jgi:hypothetical protein
MPNIYDENIYVLIGRILIIKLSLIGSILKFGWVGDIFIYHDNYHHALSGLQTICFTTSRAK